MMKHYHRVHNTNFQPKQPPIFFFVCPRMSGVRLRRKFKSHGCGFKLPNLQQRVEDNVVAVIIQIDEGRLRCECDCLLKLRFSCLVQHVQQTLKTRLES